MHDHCEHFQAKLNILHKAVTKELPQIGLLKTKDNLHHNKKKIYMYVKPYFFLKT